MRWGSQLLSSCWVLLSLSLGACSSTPQATSPPQPEAASALSPEDQALVAFAKVYGYVRWFYPGDEAFEADWWTRFAVEGAGRMLQVHDTQQLRPALEAAFAPLAHNLKFYADGEPHPFTPLPSDTGGLQVVAWQHYGAGLGGIDRLYKSLRLNREAAVKDPGAGMITQFVDAKPYRGMRIQLRGALRVQQKQADDTRGHLYLNVMANQRSIQLLKMEEHPVRRPDWQVYEIEATVADEAERIVFGVFMRGAGSLGADDLELRVAPAGSDQWRRVTIPNAGFEQDARTIAGWTQGSRAHRFWLDTQEPHAGKQSLAITPLALPQGPLFAEHAMPGDVLDLRLADTLHAFMPLALYSDARSTLPRLATAPYQPPALPANFQSYGDERVRIAAAVVAWNAFQHFYPYFDVVQTDWNAELPKLLAAARQAADAEAMQRVLQRLVHAAHDGHGRVMLGGAPKQPYGELPLAIGWIEGRAVVTQTLVPQNVQVGDVIVKIDGVATEALARDEDALLSGSPQWRRLWAGRLGGGDPAVAKRLDIERGGRQLQVELKPERRTPMPDQPRAHVEQLRPDIWYVDLRTTPMDEIRAHLDTLAAAKGVIFDLRGYPKDNHEILRHLLREPEQTQWMFVPKITRPDRDWPAGFDGMGWNLQPAQPHIGGRVAFLTDERAISYAESVMGYVEGLKLGEIVGSPTAGTNGNIRQFGLPGGLGLAFTGMRVLKHDGTQLHGIGVLPTVAVTPTIVGIREGRDEVLEVALRGLVPAAPR